MSDREDMAARVVERILRDADLTDTDLEGLTPEELLTILGPAMRVSYLTGYYTGQLRRRVGSA